MASPFLHRFFPSNSCLNATRVTIDVLERFGIPARPLPVVVHSYNKAAWVFSEHGKKKATDETLPRWEEAGQRS